MFRSAFKNVGASPLLTAGMNGRPSATAPASAQQPQPFSARCRSRRCLRSNRAGVSAATAPVIEWLGERERRNQPGLVEKSRDTGVSWLCCAYAVHGWLFKPGYAAGFGSLKWDEVDEIGNMGTLLEKCRFIIRNLPHWMRPPNFRQKEHAKFCCITRYGTAIFPVSRRLVSISGSSTNSLGIKPQSSRNGIGTWLPA